MRLKSRDQIQAQQPLENMIFVSFSQSCLNFLSLKIAIIAIKTRHWALVKIYSLAVGVCCKASALAASAFATNTYVSAINLHQGSAADLNPYNIIFGLPKISEYWSEVINTGVLNKSLI